MKKTMIKYWWFYSPSKPLIYSEDIPSPIKLGVWLVKCQYLTLRIDLLDINNNKISYFILWILINISYDDFNKNLFLSNLDNIYKIACFLGNNKNGNILTYRGIWLLRNITSNNNKINEELLKYNIMII